MADYWKVDEALVARLCAVARLDLGAEERKRYEEQLTAVLDMFRMLDEVDTEGVEPSFQPTTISNVWREDRPQPHVWDPLGNAQERQDGYFRGPKII